MRLLNDFEPAVAALARGGILDVSLGTDGGGRQALLHRAVHGQALWLCVRLVRLGRPTKTLAQRQQAALALMPDAGAPSCRPPPPVRGKQWQGGLEETFDMTATTTPLGTANALPTESGIKIYVACLAAYNSGHLHGRWIDASQGEAHIWDETRAMLAASPEPDAEEWAIHDYEGFEGAPISEWTSFETIAALADFIGEHETLGGKLLEHYGGDLEDAKAALEEYAGEFESLADYARDLTEQTGTEIPAQLARYIDYAAMAHDMEMGGDVFTIETGFNQVHVFWAR